MASIPGLPRYWKGGFSLRPAKAIPVFSLYLNEDTNRVEQWDGSKWVDVADVNLLVPGWRDARPPNQLLQIFGRARGYSSAPSSPPIGSGSGSGGMGGVKDPTTPIDGKFIVTDFDNFNRVVVGGMGVASSGIVWDTWQQNAGITFNVDGSKAVIVTGGIGNLACVIFGHTALASNLRNQLSMRFRAADATVMYITLTQGGVIGPFAFPALAYVQLNGGQIIVGADNNGGITDQVATPAFLNGTWYILELYWDKAANVIKGRVYKDGDPVPAWMVTAPMGADAYTGGVWPAIYYNHLNDTFEIDWIKLGEWSF